MEMGLGNGIGAFSCRLGVSLDWIPFSISDY